MFSVCSVVNLFIALAAEPISTYRGDPQRTGSDGVAGPASPKVLWSWKSTDHFIAAPVAYKDHLFVSGLGGFNVPSLTCLNIDPKTDQARRLDARRRRI